MMGESGGMCSALATAQNPQGTDITDISGTAIGNTQTDTSVQQTSSIALVKTATVSGSGYIR
jgi:hypothetical protein